MIAVKHRHAEPRREIRINIPNGCGVLCELGTQVALAVSNMTYFEEIAALNDKVEYTAQRYSHRSGDQQRHYHEPDARGSVALPSDILRQNGSF